MKKKELILLLLFISILLMSSCANNGVQKTIEASSKDKKTGTVYSTLRLTITPNAFDNNSVKVGIVAFPAFTHERFIGGHYIITPQNIELKESAIVSITYTQEAIDLFKIDYPDFNEDVYDLSIAYNDEKTFNNIPIESTYDRPSRTVSAHITKFYKSGFLIIPLRKS